MRKLGIILLSAFAHNDSLQLHFTMALLIFSFILHSTYHPFDISSSSGKRQGAKKESRLSCYECCCGHDGGTTEGIILHRMERNSIIISIMVLWSAVVFILNQTCQTSWCVFLSTLCVVFLLLSNLVFLVAGGRNFFRLLLQRIEKGKQRRLRESSVAAAGAALALNFIINPALGCDDPALDHGEEKTKSLTRGETVYTQNAAWQGVELTVLPPSSEIRPQPPSPRPRLDGAAFHAPPKGPSPRQTKVPPPPKRSAASHQPKRPQNIREDEYRKKGCWQYCKCFGYGYAQKSVSDFVTAHHLLLTFLQSLLFLSLSLHTHTRTHARASHYIYTPTKHAVVVQHWCLKGVHRLLLAGAGY